MQSRPDGILAKKIAYIIKKIKHDSPTVFWIVCKLCYK